jgi:SAM-dependent methyltransferase
MTGLDFSSASLEQARSLAKDTGADIEYFEGNVYSAPELLGRGEFDLVYTGVGALCWLPNVAEWGKVVADLLKPDGRLFIREGHPILWALDDEQQDRIIVDAPYFETVDPSIYEEEGTYVATDAQFRHNITHTWNHGIGEIVMSLIAAGMELTSLVEHQSVPWEAMPGQMVQDEQGEWRLKERPERLAATYTLQAVKSS